MKKTLFQKKVLFFIAITLITWMFVLPRAYGSIFTSTPPTIDGNASEWTSLNSTRVTVTNGFVHLMNDANYLYVLIDVTSDTGNDPVGQDYFWLTFDVNRNSQIDANTDVNFAVTPAGNICIEYYIGPGTWTGSCTSPSGLLMSRGFGTSLNSGAAHRIWELQIPRNLIGATSTNSPLRFALRLYSQNPSFTADTPPNFYNDFSTAFLTDQMDQMGETGLIDPTNWANLEFIRRAENGALHSAVRTYESGLNNMLLLKDPSGVNSIEAKVTLNAINTTNLYAGARIGGFFFSDDTGDYFAQIEIEQPASSYLRAYYFYERCTSRDLQCTTFDDHYIDIIGLPNIGESHTLGITYDGVKSFTFKFDTTSVTIHTNANVSHLGLPSVEWKGIGTRVFGPSGPGVSGYVDANFENVLLNGNPTAISNGMIDDTTWSGSTLEFVREQVTDGVYGMALRSYGSYANNGLNLVNGQSFNELQADLTVEQLINLPQPNPATPMAALQGNFYKAGAGVPGDQTGDIKALVGIRHNGTQPAAFYNIVQCTAPNCSIYPGEFDRLYFHEDPLATGPDLLGKPHRVSIRYNATSNTFTFGFDGRLTTPGPSDPGWLSYPLPAYSGPPNGVQKGPLARIAFFSGLSGEGSVSAQFENIATVVDTDGDGVPDSVDNCPTVYNPVIAEWIDYKGIVHTNSQPDFNLNGVGDACDLCPKVPGADGGPCPSSVGGGTASTTGPLIKVTFTYNGPATFLVPPNCNNVVFSSVPEIPQNCRFREPYVLKIVEEPAGSGVGRPGGDWVPVTAGYSSTINCNPLEIFDEDSLKAADSVTITPMYTLFFEDPGTDYAGNCLPNEICVDSTKYDLFQGTMIANPVTLTKAETQSFKNVSIDIRPLSHRNIINLQSCGYVPVAIFSAPDFDARTIKIETVQMGDAGVKTLVVGKKRIPLTLDLDVNRDGLKDKVVFFDIKALKLANYTGQVCLTGETTGGMSFIGCDSVTIVSQKSWNRLCGCEDGD